MCLIDTNIFDQPLDVRLQKGIVRSFYRHCAKADGLTVFLRNKREGVLAGKQTVKFCFRKRVGITGNVGTVLNMQLMYLPNDAVHS